MPTPPEVHVASHRRKPSRFSERLAELRDGLRVASLDRLGRTHGDSRQPDRLHLRRLTTATVAAVILFGGAYVALANSPDRPGQAALTGFPTPATSEVSTPTPEATRPAENVTRGGERTASPSPSPSPTKAAKVTQTGSCGASFYDEPQGTANGEVFDPEALTAAHKTLPFNTRVKVTNPANGKSVTVRINDRGPYIDGRCLDLSRAAFREIADLDLGVLRVVKYEVLG